MITMLCCLKPNEIIKWIDADCAHEMHAQMKKWREERIAKNGHSRYLNLLFVGKEDALRA